MKGQEWQKGNSSGNSDRPLVRGKGVGQEIFRQTKREQPNRFTQA